jgi:hypothetical protein
MKKETIEKKIKTLEKQILATEQGTAQEGLMLKLDSYMLQLSEINNKETNEMNTNQTIPEEINLEEAAQDQPVAPTEMPHDVQPKYKTNQIMIGKWSDIMPYSWQIQRFVRLYASFAFNFKAPDEFTYRNMNELIRTFENKIKLGLVENHDVEKYYGDLSELAKHLNSSRIKR